MSDSFAQLQISDASQTLSKRSQSDSIVNWIGHFNPQLKEKESFKILLAITWREITKHFGNQNSFFKF